MVMLALHDLEHTARAVELAKELALQGRRRVVVVSVDTEHRSLDRLADLHRMAAPLRSAGLQVLLRSEVGDVESILADQLLRQDIRWVVDTTGGKVDVRPVGGATTAAR